MMNMMDGMMACGGGMMLLSVLLWVLVVAGVILAVRWLTTGNRGETRTFPRDEAWELARLRFARGEISAEELERIREGLRR